LLEDLRTGDGWPLPVRLKAQIIRELDRLEVLLEQVKTVEAERDALLKPASDEAASPAAMLARLKGIGPETAAVRRPGGRMRKTIIVALARKLLIALWRTVGVVIEGAVMKAASATI
jgi:transposase